MREKSPFPSHPMRKPALALVVLLALPLLFTSVGCGKKGKAPEGSEVREKYKSALQKLSGADLESAVTHFEEGDSLYYKGNFKEAVPHYEKLSEMGIEDGILAYRLYYAYEMVGDAAKSKMWFKKTKDLLEKRIQENRDIETFYYMISLLQRLGDTQAQYNYTNQAITAFSSGAFGEDLSGDEYFQMGRIYRYAKNPTEEYELQKKAIEQYKSEGVKDSVYLDLCLEETAKKVMADKDYKTAVTVYESVLAADPKTPDATYNLGFAYFNLDDYEKAIEVWTKTKANDTKNFNKANYNMTIVKKLVTYSQKYGKEHVLPDLSGLSYKELVEEMRKAAKALTESKAKKAIAEKENKELSEEALTTYETLDYRFNQYMGEFIKRGLNLRDIAHQEGLIGLIFR